MEKIRRDLLIVSFLCLYTLPGYAQQNDTDTHPESGAMVSYGRSAAASMDPRMNPERRTRFQDPQAPRFRLSDSQGKFTLGIGGNVRSALEYDFHGMVDNLDFYPSQISVPGTGNYARNNFQLDPTGSSVYVKLLGRTSQLGDFVVYVNTYFRGSNNTLRMHNAYVSFLGFRAGWDYGLFSDPASSPPNIDYKGPAGQVNYRTNLLYYTYTFSSRWSAGLGVEIPSVSATTDDYLAVSTQRAPNVPAFVQYSWNAKSHFRVAGVLRPMTYSSDLYEKAYTETGWGIQASTVFTTIRKWKAFGQVTYGEGIGNFINDLSTQSLDLVPHAGEEGKMQVLPMLGWYAGLQYNLSPVVFVSSTYSQSRVYGRNGYPATDSALYRYGQYLAANMFWNINSNMLGGVEYLRGWKTGFDATTYTANRLSLLVQYSF